MLRSDNGTYSTSDQFKNFCKVAGIEHQLTTPYTPQQNGVSVRKITTVKEISRCILHEKELPKELWANATNTVVFLLNLLPTKAVTGQTPFEAWNAYKPLQKKSQYFWLLMLLSHTLAENG